MNKEEQVIFGFQSVRESAFPTLVQLALMHYICNSKCKKCPVGLVNRGEMGVDKSGEFDPKKRKLLSFEIFRRIADEMGKYPWSILRFHGRGEPLLHPDYVDMIDYGKRAGIETITSFTNATLLDEKIAKAILNARIDIMEMSVDAYSEKLYRDFRGTEYFARVVDNVSNFIKIRNSMGNRTKTKVIVSAVDCPEFQPEKEDFRKFWEARADKVIFRPYHTYGGRLASISACEPTEVVPCSQLWTRFSVNPWGQVNACFNDWADKEIVGDLTLPEQTIAKIWRGKEFEKIRETSLSGRAALDCCKVCLATRSGWIWTYQLLIEKLKTEKANRNLV